MVLRDKERMLRKKRQQGGRIIKILTRELRFAKYFKAYGTVRYFTDKAASEQIFYQKAALNMKSFGRVKVFVFCPENEDEWQYFSVPVRTTGAARAFALYRGR